MNQELVYGYLTRAVQELRVNALSHQLIRRLAAEEPDLFAQAALKYLETSEEVGINRYLSAVLLRDPGILDRLANPAEGSKQRAIGLFRNLLAIDPSLDVRMARKLPDCRGSNLKVALDGMKAARALDILDETSRGRRLVPVLGHLVESLDPRTAARATLLIGRRIQNPSWAAKQLTRSDDRVRASAVESLWGLSGEGVIDLLVNCVKDPCARVVGNSLIGLHMAGQQGIDAQILEMADHSRGSFRASAAWVMARVGDPDFSPHLNRLIKDVDPMVRSTALRALIEIRKGELRTLSDIASQAKEIANEPETVVEALQPDTLPENPVAKPDQFIDIRLDGSTFATRNH